MILTIRVLQTLFLAGRLNIIKMEIPFHYGLDQMKNGKGYTFIVSFRPSENKVTNDQLRFRKKTETLYFYFKECAQLVTYTIVYSLGWGFLKFFFCWQCQLDTITQSTKLIICKKQNRKFSKPLFCCCQNLSCVFLCCR